MTRDEIIGMAREVGMVVVDDTFSLLPFLERFAALVATSEREAIMDEWWICVQSDLENGVKSINERAAEKWRKEYPAIAGFADTIEARN